ncbi:ABC transporter permease [Staphylococcus capitis]|uniref:ABC transporter permease n=1 Tax=Staphylococcus capitis TaxID=29388 RepID=UPI00333F8B50
MEEVISVTFKMIWKMIKRGYVTQRHIIVPFIIAVSIMFGIEYILISITQNTYTQRHSATLPLFAVLGNVLMSMLTLIFVVYANNFVIKRRQREFAVYMILGMEKKHIKVSLVIESLINFVIISCISLIGGYLFGSLFFMLISKIWIGKSASLIDYPFDIRAMWITLIMLVVVLGVLNVINIIKVTFQSPLKLVNQNSKKTGKTSKIFTYISLLLGILLTGFGYSIALQNNTMIGSLASIFVAMLSVFIGTYFLFISLSVLILDWLKRIPNFYYKTNNFFTVSNLRSRLKSNAVSLATISLLATFLIVTLGMTIHTYRGFNERIDQIWPNEYFISLSGDVHKDKKVKKIMDSLENDIQRHVKTDTFKMYSLKSNKAEFVNNKNNTILRPNSKKFDGRLFYLSKELPHYITTYFMTLNDYNKYHPNLSLKSNEIAINTDNSVLNKTDKIKINGTEYRLKHIKKMNINTLSNFMDGAYLVTKNNKIKEKLYNYLNNFSKDDDYYPRSFLEFNVMGDKKLSASQINKINKNSNNGAFVEDRPRFEKKWTGVNGGLIFVGTVVSFVLFIAIFLMMYYKQISEGYDDRREYEVMRKIGLEQDLIKKIINKQIIWIFSIPVIVAIIHTLVASKIIFNLLGFITPKNSGAFATSFIGVTLAFIAIYSLMYWVTSRIYYMIINNKH